MYFLVSVLFMSVVISLWLSITVGIKHIIGAVKLLSADLDNELDFDEMLSKAIPVSVIVPAHNEEIVIIQTVTNILTLNYPKDKLELIVVNDASTDKTKDLLDDFYEKNHDKYDITFLHPTKEQGGGGGKSKALKKALEIVKHDTIAIYDGDAAPEKNALLFLINKLVEDESYIACTGRNKCRNREYNILTHFVNLELIVVQKVSHIGNWYHYRIAKIPGTNYVIKKWVLDELDPFSSSSLTEDTDLTFRIMQKGYIIAYEYKSEAFQQEPEKLSVYIKQRKRWAQGNIDAFTKFAKYLFVPKRNKQFRHTLIAQFLTHYWFIFALLISDIFILVQIYIWIRNFFIDPDLPNLITINDSSINLLIASWALLFLFYVTTILASIVTEPGQFNTKNFILAVAAYVSYAQLYFIVSIAALATNILDRIFKREKKWYKTERF